MEQKSFFKTLILVLVVAIVCTTASGAVVYKMMNTKSNEQVSEEVKIPGSASSKDINIYQAVAEKASPSVVGITTTSVQKTDLFFDASKEVKGVGTGIIVNKDGYILTNSHVISDGNYKQVQVSFNDGTTTNGDVIWNDKTIDLAVVKVNKKGLKPAELGDSDNLNVGDIAIAIGNPYGLELQKTVTQGIISGLNREIQSSSVNMSGLIQTDASINPGNSGGPLLNNKGQVIGINTVKLSEANSDGIGFAIPINTAKTIINKVINEKDYKKVVLGISGLDIATYEAYTGQKAPVDSGIIVQNVAEGSAAEKAGIKPGDIILSLGNKKIENMGNLSSKLFEFSQGSKSEITVYRNKKEIKLDISF